MNLMQQAMKLGSSLDISDSQELFRKSLRKVLDKTLVNIDRFGDRFPYCGIGKEYELTDNRTWVSGYWTAWLWMAYFESGDSRYKLAADRHFEGYNRRFNQSHIHCHDIGVIYDMAAVRGYAVTGEDKWRNIGLRAASVLATRFHEKGSFLQAWGLPGQKNLNTGRTIIDSLCCTPLWYWASDCIGDPYYKELAIRQTNTVLEKLVRPDNSSGHTFLFDPETEEPVGIRTFQGYSDESTWSRGQAWGIQGFAVAYANTGDPAFLDASLRMTEWFIDRLPDNLIPPWDFAVPQEERDTSALALAVNGLLRLAELSDLPEEIRQACRLIAMKSMVALIENHATLDDADAWGLLTEGVYGKPLNPNRGVKEYLIWGDYYFVENLMILAGRNPLSLERMSRESK